MEIFSDRKKKLNEYITYNERDGKVISFKYVQDKQKLMYLFLGIAIGIFLIYVSFQYGLRHKYLRSWFALICLVLSSILTIFCVYKFYVTAIFRFGLKNGVFYHKEAFKKFEAIAVDKIEDVTISKFYTSEKNKYLIVIWDKEGNRVIYTYAINQFMEDNIFYKTLKDNNIKYEIND